MCERNSRKVAVLGSGLVSNIASYLLRDTIVLTKRQTPLFFGNVFFHDRIETRLMLRMFDIEYKSEDIPVSYYDAETGQMHYEATDDIRLKIAKEKMGDTTKEIVLSDMNKNEQIFRNLIFDENKLKRILINETDVIELFPTCIQEFKDYVRVFFENEYVDFEYLINTIPQTFFNPLLYNPYDLKFNYKSLTFASHEFDHGNTMIYSYNQCFWKRVFIKNGLKTIEFETSDWNESIFKHMFNLEGKSYQKVEVPYGRIESVEVPDTKRIINIGRFAQWKHELTTEHIIRKTINLNL